MKNRAIKFIVCIAIVSCLMVGFCTSFASAEPAWLIRAKAGVSAAMLAAQLVINPINVALDSPLSEAIDPEGRIEWVETLPEYLERSKIRVYPDVVTIDGVPYTDIWLGPDAANKLRLQGLDFVSAYNILNNQSSPISYATGAGYASGLPFYQVDGNIQSQLYSVPVDDNYYDIGFAQSRYNTNTSNRSWFIKYPYQSTERTNYTFVNTFGNPHSYYNYYRVTNTNQVTLYSVNPNNNHRSSMLIEGLIYSPSPFSFDYTSGVIDAPLAEEDGLLMRVPSSYTDPDTSHSTYNYDIHDLININPSVASPTGTTVEIDPDLNPDFQTDIDLGNGVGDIIWKILSLLDLLDNIDIEFAPEPQSPEPGPQPGTIDPLPDPDPSPDEPSSGTTISNTDWTKLDEILRWIQSTIDSLRHITESLQTMLDSLFDQIQEIYEAIQSLPEQLLEDIETGPSRVFRKALDVLKSLFLPLLLPIKAMMGLWHYVVEWLSSVNAPFLWILGIMNGTSYNMVLPIYAVLAGSICIAIYKALGR